MAKVENRAPKFDAGEVHFLSHKTGAPAKIYIGAVYKKPLSKEWMYYVYSEANDCKPTYVPESALADRISKHYGRVYKLPEVSKRYDEGFRFAGNYTLDDATRIGEEFARNSSIKSVMLHPAIGHNCEPIEGEYGVWIKWNCAIIGCTLNGDTSIKIK